MKKIFIMVVILLFPSAGISGEKPTPDEVKKVMAHYYNGQGKGVYIVDAKFCADVHDSGPEKHNCKDEFKNNKVPKDSTAVLWFNFFGPEDDKASIHYEFKNDGRTRKVGDFTITGAYRYRTRISIPSDRAGEWEISLSQELENGDIDLGTFKYRVAEN